MDSAKYVTQHKRIYTNIVEKKEKIRKNKMCNKIKCAGQYTVDLINKNISRDVQEICIAAILENSGYFTVC